MDDYILQIENLSKSFPGVKALDDVSFNIRKNTIHCVVGENGAGKSTLIKIITGRFKQDKRENSAEWKRLYGPKPQGFPEKWNKHIVPGIKHRGPSYCC